MPQSLKADIEWHRARIAFYQQALEALEGVTDGPDTTSRQQEVRLIIADLQKTLHDLEEALASRL